MKKSVMSKVFGFIAMGLALISIGMLFLPFVSVSDDEDSVSVGLTTFIEVRNVITDEIDDLDDVSEAAEVFADGFEMISDEAEKAVAGITLIIAMAFVSMAFALITAPCAAIDVKATRIISIVTSFIAFAAAVTDFIVIAAAVSKVKDAIEDAFGRLADEISIHVGIGLILAVAFLFIAMIMAILALVFMGKTAVAGGQFNGGFGVGNYPDDTVVNGGGYGQQPMAPVAPAAPVQPKASLTFLSGSCAGYQIPMDSGEEVVIGKDPALCAVVIDKKYDKVSRKHCGVRFDAMRNMYIVTDYSTNGTRVVGGQKLTPHSTSYVERGTTINLGHTENSFRLN